VASPVASKVDPAGLMPVSKLPLMTVMAWALPAKAIAAQAARMTRMERS
jgi:hypothetical protein